MIYITNPTMSEARKTARHIINNKLIACANIFPIERTYPWKGKILEEKEFVLIAKTEGRNYSKIIKEVEKIHPYKVPCIIKIPVRANGKYDKWIKNNII